MKKILFWGVIIFAVVLSACKKDNNSILDAQDLQDASNLKMTVSKSSSIFEPIEIRFNKKIGTQFTDKENNVLRINIDSLVFSHKPTLGDKRRIAGSLDEKTDSSYIFTPVEVLKLGEPYFLTSYFSWEQKDGDTWVPIKSKGKEYYRSLWAGISPRVLDGKDVSFSTKRGGEGVTSLIPYDDNMFIKFNAPVIFDINNTPGNAKIALLFNSIDIKGNNKEDYAIWNLVTDSVDASFTYLDSIPTDDLNHTHLLPNTFYTISIDMNYVYKNSQGKWDYVINSLGDTTVWNYQKEYSTQDLFVPGKIINKVYPERGTVMIDTIPLLEMSANNYTETTYNGILFRQILDDFNLQKGSTTVPANFAWLAKGDVEKATGDSIVATLAPDSLFLVPNAEYLVSASAHWEYKVDTVWNKILELDTVKREVIDVKINTRLPKPPKIVSGYNVETENINMNSVLFLTLGKTHKVAFDLNGFKFRPVVDEFQLKEGTNIIIDSTKWDESNTILDLVRDSFLLPGVDYNLVSRAHWEYQDKDGIFKQLNNDGLAIFENSNKEFLSMTVPNRIVENIIPRGSGIDLNVEPEILLNYSDGEVVTKDGISFRANLGDITLFTGQNVDSVSNHIPVSVEWVNTTFAKVKHDRFFELYTKYSLQVLAFWEYEEDGKWKTIADNDGFRVEGKVARGFRTTAAPDVLFGELFPSGENISIDSTIILNLFYGNDSEFDYGGTKFKVNLDMFEIMVGDSTVASSFEAIDDDLKIIELKPQVPFTVNTTYKAKAMVSIMYKNEEGNWITIELSPDELKNATKETTFKTVEEI